MFVYFTSILLLIQNVMVVKETCHINNCFILYLKPKVKGVVDVYALQDANAYIEKSVQSNKGMSNKYMLITIGLLLIYNLFYMLIHPSLLGIRIPNKFRFWVPLELIYKYNILYLKNSKSLW